VRERGAEDGVRAVPPRAYALGYYLPPLTGLVLYRPLEQAFVNELLIQDTKGQAEKS